MSAHKDEESFLDDIATIMKENLSDEVTAINDNKNDGIDITTVEADRFFESLNDEVFNFHNGFIYYGIKSISPTSNMSATASEITMFFDYMLLDDLTTQTSSHKNRKRVMRFSKAMRQVIQKYFEKVSYASDLEITTLSPQDFKNLESGESYKMGGIELKGTIFY